MMLYTVVEMVERILESNNIEISKELDEEETEIFF